MRKLLLSLFLSLLVVGFCSSAFAEGNYTGDLLTGDARLACEAILCLSTGQKPSECAPSLNRYFGIHFLKPSDTLKGRKNFLKMCPSADEDTQMSTLTNAIARGAGNCEPEALNKLGIFKEQTVEVFGLSKEQCFDYASQRNAERFTKSNSYHMSLKYYMYNPEFHTTSTCTFTESFMEVNAKAPDYCEILWNHSYTDYSGSRPHFKKSENAWESKWGK